VSDRPTPVTGYRDLSQEEVDLINAIKDGERAVGSLWEQIQVREETDDRMAAIAKTCFQDAFMWLVRSVAKPQDFFYETSE
jgi:hypothetical protein